MYFENHKMTRIKDQLKVNQIAKNLKMHFLKLCRLLLFAVIQILKELNSKIIVQTNKFHLSFLIKLVSLEKLITKN